MHYFYIFFPQFTFTATRFYNSNPVYVSGEQVLIVTMFYCTTAAVTMDKEGLNTMYMYITMVYKQMFKSGETSIVLL